MEWLRSDYTEVWAASQNLPLARFPDRNRSIASTGLDLLEIDPPAALIDRLRAFDSIVSWYGANRPEFRDRVQALGLSFRFFPALPPESSTQHAVDFFLEQAAAPPGGTPCITCSRQQGDFAVIHPFASSPKKRWSLDRFQELERSFPRVCWCAGPEEELAGAVRIENLYELACWIASARIYIGNDSGITHLAAAVGTPVVALFGPTDPRVWAPRGERVRVVAKPSMEAIDIEEVKRCVTDLS